MLKNSCLFLLASLPAIAYSNANGECCEPFLPPQPIESCQVPVGYYFPAQYRLGECGFDVSLSGQFIYWEVNRDSVTLVGTNIESLNNGEHRVETSLIHHQGYRPGFIVAAGVGLPGCDNWRLDVEYTWFHHESTNHFTASEGGHIQQPFVPLFLNPNLFGFNSSAAKSELRFNLDFLAATVGRSFYLSRRLVVNAGVGLKSWWSDLDSNLIYTALDGSIGSNRSQSGLWGIGPYVTAQIKGLLWCGTYLFGKAGIWPNYTRFNKFKNFNDFPLIGYKSVERIPTYYYVTQLFYEGGIGLGWGTYLCDCNYHIDLLVGYDMMTTYVRAFAISSGDVHREFYYQGLSVKAQFDF